MIICGIKRKSSFTKVAIGPKDKSSIPIKAGSAIEIKALHYPPRCVLFHRQYISLKDSLPKIMWKCPLRAIKVKHDRYKRKFSTFIALVIMLAVIILCGFSQILFEILYTRSINMDSVEIIFGFKNISKFSFCYVFSSGE